MCERATGLSSLFTAVWLQDKLTYHTVHIPAYGIDGLQGELSGLLVRSVSDVNKAGKLRVIACD